MRSNKGITLTSLIIYIIILNIVIGVTAILTTYLSKGIRETQNLSDSPEKYARFTTYLTNDINSSERSDVEVEGKNIIISFNGDKFHEYIYKDNKMYYFVLTQDKVEKKITLLDGVSNAIFTKSEDDSKLHINMTINEKVYINNYSIY